MEELRSNWKIPSIAHFCQIFQSPFKLPNFDYEELELAFLSKTTNNTDVAIDGSSNNHLLVEIIVTLLKGYFKHHVINSHNWQQYLIKLFEIQYVRNEKQTSPLLDPSSSASESKYLSFDDLSLHVKVNVVYNLCEFRLYLEDACNAANEIDVEKLRLEPIGSDSQGYNYWYFFGTRLYKENPAVAKRLESKLSTPVSQGKRPLSKTPNKDKADKTRKSLRETVNGNLSESASSGIPLSELKESWSLICSSLEDWRCLLEKLNKSRSEIDVRLSAILEESYFPNITEIFQRKEKEARKRLFDFVPRRGSSRLEAKKLQKEQEEKAAQEERESRKRRRAEAEERAKMEEERKRQELIKKDRERRALHRLAIIEETAEVVHQEEAAEGQDTYTSDSNSSDVNSSNQEESCNSEPYSGWAHFDTTNAALTVEELYEGLPKVISSVMSNRDAWPFKDPVDEKTAPMYYSVIKKPIDLSVIKRRVERHMYSTVEEMEKDFKLMVNNCETYNGDKNGYTLMAYACWRAFRRAVRKYLGRDLKYDEQTVFIYPPKITRTNPKAAIEARKRKRRRRRGMKALEILKRASEIACQDTMVRGVHTPLHSEHESEVAYNVEGDDLARYVYNTTRVSEAVGTNPLETDANLKFKSLSEWSESLKETGNKVVLPHNTVFITSSPITSAWVTNGPGIKSDMVLKVVADSPDKSTVKPNETLPTLFTTVPVQNNDSRRLVIKLSKCKDSGTCWKPVSSHINGLNPSPDVQSTTPCSALREQPHVNLSSSSSGWNVKCNFNSIPVKKRVYIPPSDSETENNEKYAVCEKECKDNRKSPVEASDVKFQITEGQRNENTHLKVLRLKRVSSDTQSISAHLQNAHIQNGNCVESKAKDEQTDVQS